MVDRLWVRCLFSLLGIRYHVPRPRRNENLSQVANNSTHAEVENVNCLLQAFLKLTLMILFAGLLFLVTSRMLPT